METNFSGRIRNTSLPYTKGLHPLFKAVVNSIHAIEESGNTAKGTIRIQIIRKSKTEPLGLELDGKKVGRMQQEDIIGFVVIDNGVGFTDTNMKSFQTLDTEHKVSKGCRGVGRLLWLKAFGSVHVKSVFLDESGNKVLREFDFSASGVTNERCTPALLEAPSETIVELRDFKSRYRDAVKKTLSPIAENLLEHCLWYFVRPGGFPSITIADEEETIRLDDLCDQNMHTKVVRDHCEINGTQFDLLHVKIRSSARSTHALAFCASDRLVTEETLTGKLPGLHGRIEDGDSGFFYECYVSSVFLDDAVRPERTGFEIPEAVDTLFANTEITFPQIRDAVTARAAEHLKPFLAANLGKAKERINRFVNESAPRYRSILKHIPDTSLNIDPMLSNRELEAVLHRHYADLEQQLITDGHEMMHPVEEDTYEEYKRRLHSYLQKAEDIKRSDLASYVSHRKVILDLLALAIKRNADGKYAREDLIHNLVMPMGSSSDDVSLDSCNLWLLDERLAFHNYLASDKTLAAMPITGSKETKEPDICALNVFDNPLLVNEGHKLPLASITVIELKRPMRQDVSAGETSDPVEQAISYLKKIRKGKATTTDGRPIPQSEQIPGFCYILADITPQLQERCLTHHDLTWTHDKMGFFGYKRNCDAYIEVISLDRLVNGARERNRAFFDKLGLPAN